MFYLLCIVLMLLAATHAIFGLAIVVQDSLCEQTYAPSPISNSASSPYPRKMPSEFDRSRARPQRVPAIPILIPSSCPALCSAVRIMRRTGFTTRIRLYRFAVAGI
jgi:hypothetical protein